ncbi:MAG TPA: DUF2264 domain-containing protein, partial [Rhodoglobus sp.]|nr:DUF2264 domain-containing protein [Rhodoglobus sp.]
MTIESTTTTPGALGEGDWTREQWLDYADLLLDGARRYASPNHARITPPGAEGGYGTAVDGLEGFARTFLLAGFRIAGERGQGVDDLIDFYIRGIAAGVDPDAPDRWVRLTEHPQAKVEAASLALILDLTWPWIWDRLDATTQQRVIDYFAPAVGDQSYPRTNWLWFRLVVQTFLRSVGGPWSPQDVAADLALHDSFGRADGWLSDGDERSYDHYVGWALHLYPVLWSRMSGAAELAAGRTERDIVALDRYLQDAIALVGADGSPLIQGRSLIYRFAAAAPFWVGAMAEVPSLSAGTLRHAAGAIVGHFAEHGSPDANGVLSMGWHHEWRRLAQNYSGPASPYWATKGMLGIALPADHPVWSAPAQPLPVQLADTRRAVSAAGWLISGTAADGIVRVINHGTDHAAPGTLVGDSPLYARLGYSTATAPLLNGRAWGEALEQSVALLDPSLGATHRAAMELTEVRQDADAGVAASVATAHWLAPFPQQTRHGSGIEGDITVAGRVETVSVVRGAWEVRLVRVLSLEPGSDPVALRVGGWAVAGEEAPSASTRPGAAIATDARVRSGIHSLSAAGDPEVVARDQASPLGDAASVPVLSFPVEIGRWIVTAVELAGVTTTETEPPTASVEGD